GFKKRRRVSEKKLRVWERQRIRAWGSVRVLIRRGGKKGFGGRRSSVVSEVAGVRESLVGGLRWASEDGDASSEKLIAEQGGVDSMIRLVSCVEIFCYAGKGISKMYSL
ncbi:hypothetical protein U1Q18_007279, partial [Sarracenia purpurea var. burkii]